MAKMTVFWWNTVGLWFPRWFCACQLTITIIFAQVLIRLWFQRWCPQAFKYQHDYLIGYTIGVMIPQMVWWSLATSRPWFLILKVPMSSKVLFSHLILCFMQWTSAKNFFDLDKKRSFNEVLKTWKSYFLAVDPCRWSQHLDVGHFVRASALLS